MPAPAPARVVYAFAARRHMTDAEALFSAGRLANAGQLYGFVAECGLKALLIACGIKPDADGSIPAKLPAPDKGSHPLRKHMPALIGNITAEFRLIPDGSKATEYLTMMPNWVDFDDWLIDHRYWDDTSLPLVSVNRWRTAARQITNMLDQAKLDGVL